MLATLPLIIVLLLPAVSSGDEPEVIPFDKTVENAGDLGGVVVGDIERAGAPGIQALAADLELGVSAVIAQIPAASSTSRHPGIKEMAIDLVGSVKHLPSKENLF